ncbi:TRAP transporter small permease [Evansella tamaricis]|uniref:TRAP transporter small permease n=1 Tax=Evansella tamaricis TaxID=2069301 RepID=A0ABS6JEL1_9BACI|nr:TRAP transporter small permease [Evansella tamaricis]MBU9711639.1 TRAP transporter small permease [Evansella tamaricis]
MNFIKQSLDKVLGIFCVALLGFLVILVTWQVFTRFVLNNPSVISEELAKIVFVWLVLFGSAYVFGERGHMAIEFLKDKLPLKIKTMVEIFIEVVIFGFAGFVLVWGGIIATNLTMTQQSAALQVPIGYLYSALPISGVLILFYCLYNIVEIIKKMKSVEA